MRIDRIELIRGGARSVGESGLAVGVVPTMQDPLALVEP